MFDAAFKKKGFTLLEVLIVVIIVSILSTLVLVQYSKLIERQYGRNALALLRAIKSAQIGYYVYNETFTTDRSSLDLSAGIFDADNYFDITISPLGSISEGFEVKAIRKSNARPGYSGKKMILKIAGSAQDINTTLETDDVYEFLQ
ncbi:MAG: prepilin-type N-terminal cleavage/methylation domain-containing protein [Candidatus Omnitrophica bacterium]|nr:prepilin-type N-terminal cleavage/methylation domain-containing protein [Candidatus Omnitrophota bacterium]